MTMEELLALPVGEFLRLISVLLARIGDGTTLSPELEAGHVDVGLTALDLLTVPEVAKLLRLSEGTVWRRIRAGAIGSVTIGRARRITPEQVAAFIGSLADER
jgi:excisionase family DNA binding protein